MEQACGRKEAAIDGGYALLANKNYRQPTDVTLTLSAGTKAKLFDRIKSKERTLKVKDNKLIVTLQPGDAELVRLY